MIQNVEDLYELDVVEELGAARESDPPKDSYTDD